jgi:hypothetical protein
MSEVARTLARQHVADGHICSAYMAVYAVLPRSAYVSTAGETHTRQPVILIADSTHLQTCAQTRVKGQVQITTTVQRPSGPYLQNGEIGNFSSYFSVRISTRGPGPTAVDTVVTHPCNPTGLSHHAYTIQGACKQRIPAVPRWGALVLGLRPRELWLP